MAHQISSGWAPHENRCGLPAVSQMTLTAASMVVKLGPGTRSETVL
jgi:hypothetical protein